MGERSDSFKQKLVFVEQRSLYDYWRSKSRPGALPGRKDMHPGGMVRLLPYISLTDVVRTEGHFDFTIRLAGTGLRRLLDVEITGRALDELPFGPALAHWRDVHKRIVEERMPLCGAVPHVWHGGHVQAQTNLAHYWVKFPLADESGDINTIMAYDIFTPLARLSPAKRLAAATL